MDINKVLELHEKWLNNDEGEELADLRDADLSNANLSNAKNLLNSADYILAHFDKSNEGIIAYKTFGAHYQPNLAWEIKPGAVLEEVVNPNRTNECGCGINVGTLEWVKINCEGDSVFGSVSSSG